jgi:photosystem II stability/assembly factor-like uncharacterized protein
MNRSFKRPLAWARVHRHPWLDALVLGLALTGALISPAWAAPFADPLDQAAQMRTAINTRPFLAVSAAGQTLVAVGSRGMIALSKDQGQRWQQSVVPVQSDLLALHYPTATQGWAVGHDGVILHSADGGSTWTKQLDGRQAAVAFKKYYSDQLAAQPDDPAAQKALATLEQNFKAGPALPLLDVWFADANTGYAVGSFGMLVATQDGGKTWTPWLHRIDNPEQLNLNAVRGINGEILIAAERGQVFRFGKDQAGQAHFTAVASGYTGSFFGFVGNPEVILAFGLRGVVYRSTDQARSWAAVAVPGEASIAAGAQRLDAPGFVLVNAAGQLIVSNAAATEYRLIAPTEPMRFTGVVPQGKQSVVTTGLAGIKTQRLPVPLP